MRLIIALAVLVSCAWTKPVPDHHEGHGPLAAFVASIPECQALIAGPHTIPNCDATVSQCFADAHKKARDCMTSVMASSEHKECFKNEATKSKAKDVMVAACKFHKNVGMCMAATSAPGDEFSALLAASVQPPHTHDELPHKDLHEKHSCMKETHEAMKACAADGIQKCTNFKVCIGQEQPTDESTDLFKWYKVNSGLKHQKHEAMKAAAAEFKTCAHATHTTEAPQADQAPVDDSESSEETAEVPQGDAPDDDSSTEEVQADEPEESEESEEEVVMKDAPDDSSTEETEVAQNDEPVESESNEEEEDKMMKDAPEESSEEEFAQNDPPSEDHEHNSDEEEEEEEEE